MKHQLLLSLTLLITCNVHTEIANTHALVDHDQLQTFVIDFLNSSPAQYNSPAMWHTLHDILEGKATFAHVDIDINMQHDSGVTMLYCAVRQNMPHLVRSLLAQKADSNIPENSLLNYPLHAAADNGSDEMIKLLCLFDAEVNVFNIEHQTPLLRAVLNNHTSAVATLLACGADKTIKDRHGRKPIDYAKARKYTEIEALLS